MLHPSTQYKLCVLQGLVVEQPIQFCPLYQSVAVFVLNSDADKQNCDYATSFLEIYVQLYDFEEFCRRMKQNRIKSKYLRNVDFTKLLITDCRI